MVVGVDVDEVVLGLEVLDEVVVLVVVGVVVVVADVVVWQSLAASSPTVVAPCRRFWRRVGLSLAWRFETALPNPATAVAAAPH